MRMPPFNKPLTADVVRSGCQSFSSGHVLMGVAPLVLCALRCGAEVFPGPSYQQCQADFLSQAQEDLRPEMLLLNAVQCGEQ